jgi:dUTP pyrophosphatase
MKIKIKKLKDAAKLPSYALPGDVGMDMYSMENVTIPPLGHVILFHGFALEFSTGYAAIVKDKSGISKKDFTQLEAYTTLVFEVNTIRIS